MKKILLTLFITGFLAVSTQAMAFNISVTQLDDATYFAGPFPGTQMWLPDRMMFRDHPAFDGQSYLKFDIANYLAGFSGADIISASLSFSTYHVTEDRANMIWGSPLDGSVVNLAVSAYASAVNMNWVTQPRIVADTIRVTPHTVTGLPQAITPHKTYLETIELDMADMVRGWLDGAYANHGIKLDILRADPGTRFYMWAFTMEDGMHQPELNVQVVPVPAAVWLLGFGIMGLVGLRRRKK